MAMDGFTIAALTKELQDTLVNGHVSKVAQPESDEILLTFKNNKKTHRLLLSANPSLPLAYLTQNNKLSPMTAPNFCMLLRKHLNGCLLLSVTQLNFDRVLKLEFQGYNELGDLTRKNLYLEIMGKHSNLILTDEDQTILDSIRHVSASMSSLREVIPGRDYFIPNPRNKANPFQLDLTQWNNSVLTQSTTVAKGLCGYFSGFSMIAAYEICYRAGVDGDAPFASLNGNKRSDLYRAFQDYLKDTQNGSFSPCIYYEREIPKEFNAFPLTMYDSSLTKTPMDRISQTIETYYEKKAFATRIHQKTVDLRKNIQILSERNVKKIHLLEKQLAGTEKMDRERIRGELIQTHAHEIPEGSDQYTCINYYTGEEITIPLKKEMSPIENSNHFFKRYQKLKRTKEAVTDQLSEALELNEYLHSLQVSVNMVEKEGDILAIKEEMALAGLTGKHASDKRKTRKEERSKPLQFRSSDGYVMYVGKNNLQNEELTFKVATGNDWWFHVKGAPGSHVIVICNNEEPPITTFEEAAGLAAFYSSENKSPKVEVDYTQKKHLKKTKGQKPGFVIYHTNYSMMATPSLPAQKEEK